MPIYRGDFDVHAEIVLPDGAPPLEIKTIQPFMELRLRNGPKDAKGHVTALIAELIANVEQPDNSRQELTALLVKLLDVMSFVTHNGYKLIRCQRVIFWEPHATTRELRVYNVFDPYYPPLPELTQDLLNTVQTLLTAQPASHVLRALACFRKGVLEQRPEDQFQQFWFAMEVIAEGMKEDDARPIGCPTCQNALMCVSCNKEPTRRLSGRQGIRKLIHQLLSEDEARLIDQGLGKARNKLMHGSTPAAVEVELGVEFTRIINKAAWLAWHAIMSAMPSSLDDDDTPLQFMHREGQFARHQMVPGVVAEFQCDSAVPFPAPEQIPTIEIDQEVSIRTLAQEAPGDSA